MRLTVGLSFLLSLPAASAFAQVASEPAVTPQSELPQEAAPAKSASSAESPRATPPVVEGNSASSPASAIAEGGAQSDATASTPTTTPDAEATAIPHPTDAAAATPPGPQATTPRRTEKTSDTRGTSDSDKQTALNLQVPATSASAESSTGTLIPPSKHPLLAIDNELFLGAVAITAWGIHHWKWFKSAPKMKIENGFTSRSSTGGSDKTGHFFAGFIVGDMLAWRLRDMGYDRVTSALWGATGSMALMTWIEMGDSTSHYGWSFEDMLADFVGVTTSAMLGIFPTLDRLLDFRVQYWPTKGFLQGKDVVADYSGMKHLAAIKMSGIPFIRDTPLRFLEAQVGFYSRGFRSFDVDPERRVLYVGIGVTANEILEPVLKRIPGGQIVAPAILHVFEYYQPPILAHEVAKDVFRTPPPPASASN